MEDQWLLSTQIAVLILLLMACIAAIALNYLRFPYSVGLVILGFGLSWISDRVSVLHMVGEADLSPDLILFLFLPPLIFESSLSLEFRLLARNLVPVVVLAAPGLVISAGIVSILLGWFTPLSLAQAFVFGALISATDPVAVIALMKEVRVPQRLTVLMEGESLFNDATAIVVFNVVSFSILSGGSDWADLGWGSLQVGVVLLGGILVGVAMSLVMGYFILLARHNPLIQGTVSAIVAYAAFIVAEHGLHVSGVIAVMSAGLVVGWLNNCRLAPQTREFLREFWAYISFIANSLIFLLIGINTESVIEGSVLTVDSVGRSIAIAIGAALLARAVTVFTLIPLINRSHWAEPIEIRHQVISFWGGLRGAVALALALSLQPEFPNRDLVVVVTVAVALFTILAGGLTIKPMLHCLQLDHPPLFAQLFQARALVEARQQGISHLQDLKAMSTFSAEVIARLERERQAAFAQAKQDLMDLWSTVSQNPGAIQQAVWMEALNVERKLYQQLYDQGVIGEETLDKLYLMVNLKEDEIRMNQIPSPRDVTLPDETQIEGMMTRLADWILSPLERRLGKQPRSRDSGDDPGDPSLQSRCEYLFAIAFVSQQVRQEIRQFAQDLEEGAEDPARMEMVEQCIQSYQRLADQVRQLMDRQESLSHLEPLLEERLARQAVWMSEEDVIKRLLAEGSIQEQVAESIRAQL